MTDYRERLIGLAKIPPGQGRPVCSICGETQAAGEHVICVELIAEEAGSLHEKSGDVMSKARICKLCAIQIALCVGRLQLFPKR